MATPYARAALLDRDGTVIADRGYLADPAGVEVLPGAAEGLARMRSFGLGLAIVTNQSGVGRGISTRRRSGGSNLRIEENCHTRPRASSWRVYCAPRIPEPGCDCAQTEAGRGRQGERQLGFDPTGVSSLADK